MMLAGCSKRRRSHPPTHWHAETCHLPGRGPSDFPTSPEGAGRLFFTARIERPPLYRGGSASKKNGLPAPSHPFRPRVARARGSSQLPQSPFSASCLGDDVAYKIVQSGIRDLNLDEFPCCGLSIIDIHDAVN